ncbi:MAG: imidazole glycerol phosphate synthase subunit HisH [Chitinophagaceae bacterium]|nr:imidazole glycerol phosphate synthase subunit HisH [Chitinophagaceae bacterium]
MIGIVDYGMGNLLSVFSAFEYLGADVMICKDPKQLAEADRIVIPGVGAFKDCIGRLHSENFVDTLNNEVLIKKKPVLGICLGMQVMAGRSFEGGEFKGLGWIDADVVKLHPAEAEQLKVPNIGWNEIDCVPGIPLFAGLPPRPDLYLVHSYYMKCNDPRDIVATYTYGHQVTAAVLKQNIFATQFHPEKSQDNGLQILQNFIKWTPECQKEG